VKANNLEERQKLAIGRSSKKEIEESAILVKRPSRQDGQETHEPG